MAKNYEEFIERKREVKKHALPIGEKMLKETYPDESFENVRVLGERCDSEALGDFLRINGRTKIFVSAVNSDGKRRRYRVGFLNNETGEFTQDFGVEEV